MTGNFIYGTDMHDLGGVVWCPSASKVYLGVRTCVKRTFTTSLLPLRLWKQTSQIADTFGILPISRPVKPYVIYIYVMCVCVCLLIPLRRNRHLTIIINWWHMLYAFIQSWNTTDRINHSNHVTIWYSVRLEGCITIIPMYNVIYRDSVHMGFLSDM